MTNPTGRIAALQARGSNRGVAVENADETITGAGARLGAGWRAPHCFAGRL